MFNVGQGTRLRIPARIPPAGGFIPGNLAYLLSKLALSREIFLKNFLKTT